jgi:hypothetical protein
MFNNLRDINIQIRIRVWDVGHQKLPADKVDVEADQP